MTTGALRLEVDPATWREVEHSLTGFAVNMVALDGVVRVVDCSGSRPRIMGIPVYHPDEDGPFARLVLLGEQHDRAIADAPDVVETITIAYTARIDW